MRWFKHMSDLSRDEGIARLLDKAEEDWLTAYGFLSLVLEAIAGRMNSKEGHLVCSLTYSIRQWGRTTYSHPNRVTKYLELIGVIDWVDVEFDEGLYTVSIPRMVDWRDETTRKSGALPEQFAEIRVDKTTEKINTRKEPSTHTLPDSETADRLDQSVEDLMNHLDVNKV